MEWLLASTMLRGNGLAEVVTDGAGRLTKLCPTPWNAVSVQILRNGRLVYDIVDAAYLPGFDSRPRRLLHDEVLHLKDRSDDGLLGRSRLQRAAAVVTNAAEIQDFSVSMWTNQGVPSGVLEIPHKLPPEAYSNLTHSIREETAGTRNARKILVLEQGTKWQAISVSPEDAELLASRRFTIEELARLYQVPPPIIGDLSHGTFTNAETVGRSFAQQTLASWIRKLEAEFARSVFSAATRATHEIEWDLLGFLRGDPETRWKSHEIAVRNAILSPNEVRLVEGWNPVEGGD